MIRDRGKPGSGQQRFLFERAEALAGTGSWVRHADGSTEWSRNALRLLGVAEGEECSLLELVHPDDRHLRAEDTFAAAGSPLTVEYRVVRPADRRTIWVRETGVAEPGTDGGPATLYGSIADVSELHDALAHDSEQTTLLDALFDSPFGLVVYGRDLRYLRVNGTYASWSGIAAADHVGRRVDDIFPGLGRFVESATRRVLENGEPITGVEAPWGDRWYRSSRYPVRSADGRVVAVASITDDITHVKRLEGELDEQMGLAARRMTELELMQIALTEQATTDSLTGISNRRHITARLHEAFARTRRSGTAVAVLMLDLDGFKAINDADGHAAGDRALLATADILRSSARAVDLPARIGGDEFVMLLSDLEPSAARSVAETVAARLEARLAENGIEASIGAAISLELPLVPDVDAAVEELIQAADRDMYRAKSARRAARRETDAA